MPFISIVIPTYNRAHSVNTAIDTVLAQTFADYEIIVIDDGSTDNTKDVLRPYADKIHYIYQANKGVSAARNAGIKAAQGEWIAFLDSDDEWLPRKLELQVLDVHQYPEAVLSCTNVLFKGCPETEPVDCFKTCLSLDLHETQFVEQPLFKCYAFTPTVLAKREALLAVNMFDENLTIYEDGDLFFRLSTLGGFAVNPTILVIAYRRQEDLGLNLSAQFIENKEKYCINVIKSCQKYGGLNLTDEQKTAVKNKLSDSWFDLGIVYHHSTKRNHARKSFIWSFRANPNWKNLVKLLFGLSGTPGICYIEKRRNATKGFRRSEYYDHG